MVDLRTLRALAGFACLVVIAGACGADRASPAPASPPAAAASPPAVAAKCVIDGTVRGPNGAPAVGALVAVVVPNAPTEAAIVHTTEGGAFCVEGIAPGDYGLTITSPDATSAYVDVFRTGGTGGHARDVGLGGEGFMLRGRLIGARSYRVARSKVRIGRLSDFEADTFVVESAEDGSFAVKLAPGEYHARVETESAAGWIGGIKLDRDASVDIELKPVNPPGRPPPDEVVAWVKQNAVPLASTEPGRGFDDMGALRAMVGAARVVGTGEATHGTHEFFQMKHRLFEFLVEKMGFRTLVVEGAVSDAQAVDDYLRTGKGELPAARGWVSDIEERHQMLRWMRRYNEDKAHKEKLRYFGVDIMRSAGSVAALATAVGSIDKKLWTDAAAQLAPLGDDNSGKIESLLGKPPPAWLQEAEAAAQKIVARMDEKRDADVKKLGPERWAMARIHAHALADFIELVKKMDFDVRDRAMAENTLRLLEMAGPTAKMVLFAHNAHVQKVATPQGLQGKILAERLAKDYIAFGFAFDQGSFRAVESGRGPRMVTLGPAPVGSLDGALARAEMPLLAIDLRSAKGGVSRWLHTSTRARAVGAVYDVARPDAFFDVSPPAERFDALIFVAKTTATHATGAGQDR